MWSVRPATMTRRTERLSRLLRLWLTTMPSDFATIPRLSRLSPERLCDFLARVCDYDRAADLPLRGRRLFLFLVSLRPVRRYRLGRYAYTVQPLNALLYIVCKSTLFRISRNVKKKLDKFCEKGLTIKLYLDILQSSS